jgi:hypothetical protein
MIIQRVSGLRGNKNLTTERNYQKQRSARPDLLSNNLTFHLILHMQTILYMMIFYAVLYEVDLEEAETFSRSFILGGN